jgi:FKBP-type peptidyl-prolyl cis-trans isomerase FkpA
MRIIFLFGLVVLFFATSCQNQESGTVTPSGYPYTVHKETGGEKPNTGDWVFFHAQIRNGEQVLHTSRLQGSSPRLRIEEITGRQASPVEEVLKEMAIGDSVTVEIPLDTIDPKPRGFENASLMLYDVVCIDIKTQEEIDAEQAAAKAREVEVATLVSELASDYTSGKLTESIKTTDSGLKYMIHEEGTGALPELGKNVSVHYYGTLTNGQMFDNSFARGEPFVFPLGAGQVIKGWDEGLALLTKGTKATLFIPYELGYGETGSPPSIPPRSELIFYVEVN